MTEINQLISAVAAQLLERRWRLITAESCTGGLLAAELTRLAGSSDWFEGAFVTYRPSAKQRMVGVSAQLLERYGAVSEPTARAMAEGALACSDANVSVAITGVAGPSGGDISNPVGTVWFAWALRDPAAADAAPVCAQTQAQRFSGSRDAVRKQAVFCALQGLLRLLST